jgi:hypothetical protein
MAIGKFLCREALLLGVVLWSGCAGKESLPTGFVNHTRHSDVQLWDLWNSAQTHLSRQIDLNPLQRVFSDAPPDILPGDARVWNISPHQLLVISEADVPSAAYYAETGIVRSDPTGLIACPQPCNVNYTAAYSLYAPPLSRYAASWEFAGNNFDVLVEYEFENHILKALGYDMRWR